MSLPQFVILLIFYLSARFIYSLATPTMIDGFRACGGIIMLATGFRIAGIKAFFIADMLPSMILVMPFSLIWTICILPLVG